MEKKLNYTNTYLRAILMGLKSYLNEQIEIEYIFTDGIKIHKIPVYLRMTGDNQFLTDAFVDDIPDKRVELNTDVKQRLMIVPGNFKFKSAELANPNVYVPNLTESDTELKRMMTKLKSIPMVWSMNLQIHGSSANDAFLIWEKTMELLWLYKYFNVDYKRMIVRSYVQLPDEVEMVIPQELAFKDDTTISINFPIEVHTFFPVFDRSDEVQYNKKVNWNINLDGNDIPS